MSLTAWILTLAETFQWIKILHACRRASDSDIGGDFSRNQDFTCLQKNVRLWHWRRLFKETRFCMPAGEHQTLTLAETFQGNAILHACRWTSNSNYGGDFWESRDFARLWVNVRQALPMSHLKLKTKEYQDLYFTFNTTSEIIFAVFYGQPLSRPPCEQAFRKERSWDPRLTQTWGPG